MQENEIRTLAGELQMKYDEKTELAMALSECEAKCEELVQAINAAHTGTQADKSHIGELERIVAAKEDAVQQLEVAFIPRVCARFHEIHAKEHNRNCQIFCV